MTDPKKSELPFQSVTSIQRALRDGSLDPHDILDSVLTRIRHYEPKVNAFITQIPEDALRTQADEAARSLPKGNSPPLTGIPIVVKDNTCVVDVRCTAGSKILADYVPREDAPAVSKLRRAGAIILGKTNMHEFAYGVTTNNPHYGPTRNPWSLDCIAGGSSGGSAAALAAGFAFAATGTDTGGSIRIPSAICGVSGLKPTYGLVSTAGVVPLSWTLDHVGPMARFASDIALFLQIMSTSGSAVDEKKLHGASRLR